MKAAIFKVILPNFAREKYRRAGYFSVNTNLTSTLSIVQIKFFWEYFLMSIKYKITGSSGSTGLICCVGGQKIPQKAKKSAKVIGN